MASASLAISLSFSGCTPSPQDSGPPIDPAPVVPTVTQPTGIQPGERLDVFVMEDDSFSGSYTVRSTGDVIIPKLGRVKVGGLSVTGAEKAIADALKADKLTAATVLVDRPDVAGANVREPEGGGTEIFLSGKISRPGRYQVFGIANAPPTVHQAILQAGGCSRFAHKEQVHVLRRDSSGVLRRINADLTAIESGRMRDVQLAPGDIIVVPEKMIDLGL